MFLCFPISIYDPQNNFFLNDDIFIVFKKKNNKIVIGLIFIIFIISVLFVLFSNLSIKAETFMAGYFKRKLNSNRINCNIQLVSDRRLNRVVTCTEIDFNKIDDDNAVVYCIGINASNEVETISTET